MTPPRSRRPDFAPGMLGIVRRTRSGVLAKIAVTTDRATPHSVHPGASARPTLRVLGQGDGWTVAEVVCTAGPHDRPFEERHEQPVVAVVVAGTFQYRSTTGRSLMTPGSLLLGNPGQVFECGHEHGSGDRCLSFRYAPDYFERLAADAGASAATQAFRLLRLPPLRRLAPLVAHACTGLAGSVAVAWEEVSVHLAAQVVQLVSALRADGSGAPGNAVARVTRTVRAIERHPSARLTLGRLAREAGLSPYHFLRTFERVTGVTPHQYVLRARLREAALRLAAERAQIVDGPLACRVGHRANVNPSV